jgi:ABC-type multidrug transport system ATPase subunit
MKDAATVAVAIAHLGKCYGKTIALKDVSMTIQTGECVAIVGPDGAGKTTLMKILAGILEPSAGHCLIADKTPAAARTLVGYMTQGFTWYGHLSVIENLCYAGEIRGVSSMDIAERATHWLQEFGINHVRDRAAGKLSGGMKQKLALAAALIGDPPVLLLDEPTTGIDPLSRREFWNALLRLAKRGKTIVVATPDTAEAQRCDRAIALGDGHEPVRSASRQADTARLGSVAIDATALKKTYLNCDAVKDVTLRVRYGEIVGLLGANGAGKTTAMKMLTGLLPPTSGGVTVNGAGPANARQRIGYMSQKYSLYDDLSIRQNLEFFAGAYGLARGVREESITTVLEQAGLTARQHAMAGTLPGGWKQRLAFFASLMHKPDVLFLDEPTSGMAPAIRCAVWTAIDDLARGGTAIIVTTHYIEEAERCHRVAFMVAGRLIGCRPPEVWKADRSRETLEDVFVDLIMDQGEKET